MFVHLNMHDSESHPITLNTPSLSRDNMKLKLSCGNHPISVKRASYENYEHSQKHDKPVIFSSGEFLTFEIQLDQLKELLVKVELFDESNLCVGSSYVSSVDLANDVVNITLVHPTTSQLSAQIHFDVLVLIGRPLSVFETTTATNKRLCIEPFVLIGHRGCGKTDRCSENVENTLESFRAAFEHNASFVEFDIQLTKDMVPVVFHDFHVAIATVKSDGTESRLDVPLMQFTYQELRNIKIDLARQCRDRSFLASQQLMPTLKQTLEDLPENLGMFIEVKYPYKVLESGEWEIENFFDRNVVVDRVLDVVEGYRGNKSIVLCSFDPDVCLMMNHKQSRWPVILNTCGENEDWHYTDVRNRTRMIGANFAILHDLAGIHIYSDCLSDEEYAQLTSLMKRHNKHIFSWGMKNCQHKFRMFQKSIGVTGVVFDNIDQET